MLVGLPGLAERVAVDDLRQVGQVAPLQDALLRERMIPAEQDLITIFAEDLKIQAALGHLFLKIIAVFRTEADNADFDLAVGQQLQRLACVTLADGDVEILILGQRRDEFAIIFILSPVKLSLNSVGLLTALSLEQTFISVEKIRCS